jgi:hypothetical protein
LPHTTAPPAHEWLSNATPNAGYAKRKEVILQQRKEKKQLTLERRKKYNLNPKNKDPDHQKFANPLSTN